MAERAAPRAPAAADRSHARSGESRLGLDVTGGDAEIEVKSVAGARLTFLATFTRSESRYLLIEGSDALPVHSVYLRGGQPEHVSLASGLHTLRVFEAETGRLLDSEGLRVSREPMLIEVP